MTKLDRILDAVMPWALWTLCISIVLIFIAAASSMIHRPSEVEELRARVEALEKRAEASETLRSMTINALRLDIYEVPNLGIKKVRKPDDQTGKASDEVPSGRVQPD